MVIINSKETGMRFSLLLFILKTKLKKAAKKSPQRIYHLSAANINGITKADTLFAYADTGAKKISPVKRKKTK